MKKEMNNKGFSLVELIIVIAIMAVLVGVLAPQYLKYVNNSKVSTDITNAGTLNTAFSAAIADGKINLPTSGTTTISGNGGTAITSASTWGLAMDNWPAGTLDASNAVWNVIIGTKGVEKITLSGYEVFPNPDNSTSGYKKTFNK
ncbi:MAG: type II secretion system GspH family protein [Bacteroidales bacterium]|nr:type II secretion system GspH family protein [Lachnoclostridium sp.]MCM1385066.1 type II secretion system GspH family protein [Lachnoclostridium sp.]MCM1465302.1 type II secretion system GspH family protein [Bacteroidales bacterium]